MSSVMGCVKRGQGQTDLSDDRCKPKNGLCILGTFDVDNYGDLLFPVVAQWRLPDRVVSVLSPTSRTPCFSGALAPAAMGDFDFSGVNGALIGGGNIVHLRRSSVEPYGAHRLAYALLSLGISVFAIRNSFHVLYNAPSMAQPSHFLEQWLLKMCMRQASYLSFRDLASVSAASRMVNPRVNYVPDTAFDISRVWPRDGRIKPVLRDYFVVHVNRRYGGCAETTANAIDRISSKSKSIAVFLPIGPCHGDIEYAQEVSRKTLIKSAHDATIRG